MEFEAGEYGFRVKLVRRPDSSNLYLLWGRGQTVSLRHADVDRGISEALSAAALLKAGKTPVEEREEGPTIAEVFGWYEQAELPHKSPKTAAQNRVWMDRWQEFLEPDRGVLTLNEDPRENVVRSYTRWRQDQGAADTTIGHEIVFLRSVLDWCTRRRAPRTGSTRQQARPLLPFNPIGDAKRIRTASPNAPEADREWFVRVRRAAGRIDGQGLLPLMMSLASEHGWRLSALCNLWASDIDPRPRRVDGVLWPYGALRRRVATDKNRHRGGRADVWVPMTPKSRRAAVRLLERVGARGDNPVFPAPGGRGAWKEQHALDLLHRAERQVGHPERLAFLLEHAPRVGSAVVVRHGRRTFTLAEYLERHPDQVQPRKAMRFVREVCDALGIEWSPSLEPQPGRGFHAMRRTWGKERKHLPLVDVAAAGGWHRATLLNHYQQPDARTTLDVLLKRK